jgi:hypothetical protein
MATEYGEEAEAEEGKDLRMRSFFVDVARQECPNCGSPGGNNFAEVLSRSSGNLR